jgi:hypothetical protein
MTSKNIEQLYETAAWRKPFQKAETRDW